MNEIYVRFVGVVFVGGKFVGVGLILGVWVFIVYCIEGSI